MFIVARVFGCLGCLGCLGLMTFWKVKRVTRKGAPKLSKIQYGVKPDIFKITGPPSAGPPLRRTRTFRIWRSGFSDRNCDLRNAMEFGDSSLMAKIGFWWGRGQPSSGNWVKTCPCESSMMSSLIDADAKPPMCRRRQYMRSQTVTQSRNRLRGGQSGGSVKSRASADTCTCSHETGGRGRRPQ